MFETQLDLWVGGSTHFGCDHFQEFFLQFVVVTYNSMFLYFSYVVMIMAMALSIYMQNVMQK